MRPCYLAMLLLIGGCQLSSQQQPADQIEIRKSGWTALGISVSSDGSGTFQRFGLAPPPVTGAFRITPNEFRSLEARLSEFRNEAVPRTDASSQEMAKLSCPKGTPYVTDNGAIYIRWVGKGFDLHYVASLGCDQERNAQRNAKLLEVVDSVPVPAE